jgi:hypothetical protein
LPNFRPYSVPDVDDDTWEHIRVKIVKPPWEWNTHGYLGDTPGRGVSGDMFYWYGNKGDKTTRVFQLPLINLPDYMTVGNVQVRVWFENKICRAECGRTLAGGASLVDTGNPSGAHDLEIVTHDDDASIPIGQMAFRFYRDTLNYKNIYTVAFWLSDALPGQGPFEVERNVSPSIVLETGTCTVTGGDTTVAFADRTPGSPLASMVGKVFLIYTEASPFVDPDADLDGNVIAAEAEDEITLYSPFIRSGTFDYAIVEPWWDQSVSTNWAYYQFSVPDEIGGDVEAVQWTTPLMPLPDGHFYVTGCSRNPYGVGTRMTADSESTTSGSGTYCVVLSDTNPITIDANLIGRYCEKLLIVSVNGNRTLANPTNAHCGQLIKLRIINTSAGEITITLGNKYKRGQAFPESPGPFNIVSDDEYSPI